MQRKHLGNIAIFVVAAVNVILWLARLPVDPTGQFNYIPQVTAEILSSTALVLMSCSLVLANRPRLLEPFFGGLDRMYITHKNIAILALALLTGHFAIVPEGPAAFVLGRVLGAIAFFGIGGSILLALAPRIPIAGRYVRLAYHDWKLLHRFVGVFFLIGMLHLLNVHDIAKYAAAFAYFNFFGWVGVAAYLYRELVAPFLGRKPFVVETVRKLNASTVEVTLKPRAGLPAYRAGQFLFVHFEGDKVLSEAHPFTISSAPAEGSLRVSIKASGDWTRHLYANLKPGAAARVEAGYGMFNYKTGGPTQVWIAGGIGITPFLSWVRDLSAEPEQDIHFYYSVRSELDALFWDEMAAAAAKYPRLRATLNVSSRDGSLTADKIVAASGVDCAKAHVYLCGPLPMTEAFRDQFAARGAPNDHLHYEEFNFR
jgi:predicted ferric reductase